MIPKNASPTADAPKAEVAIRASRFFGEIRNWSNLPLEISCGISLRPEPIEYTIPKTKATKPCSPKMSA